jgi:predicted DCC family thiol-disulfide oxidoreductase YuxK
MNDERPGAPACEAPDEEAALAPGAEAIWLYDGLCAFCSWSVRFVMAHERRPSSRFVAIQSTLGRDIARRHGIDPDTPSSFLFIDNGRAYAKSDGLVAMAAHLRWPWRGLAWLRVVPRQARDRLYDVVARNRYRILGRRSACELPPPHVRARFVLPD